MMEAWKTSRNDSWIAATQSIIVVEYGDWSYLPIVLPGTYITLQLSPLREPAQRHNKLENRHS
jgi:hypothetical protein